MTELVTLIDGEAVTTTLAIAEGTDVQHKNVLELVRANLADLEEFGLVAFETRVAGQSPNPTKFAVLNEPQSALLITYMRNNDRVRDFKKRLVRAFFEMREQLTGRSVQPLSPLEYARRLVNAEERVVEQTARAEKAEAQRDAEQKHRCAIEAGDGIHLTDFGKKYFSEVPARKFDEHLYSRGWLINQHNTRTRPDGSVRDGYDHRKPTAKGRPYIYDHDQGNHGGKRRFQARVRPQMEIALRDALAAEGLPVNEHSTGLVLITNEDMKELMA